MTNTTVPTDAEIAKLYAEETGFNLDDSPAALLDFARAVLAKWGTPQPVVRAPLSDKQVDELASPYLLRMFGSIKIFKEVMRRFARTIERAHGITAKEPTP